MAKHPGDDRRKKPKKSAPLTPVPDQQEDGAFQHTQTLPVSSGTRLRMDMPAADSQDAFRAKHTSRMPPPADSAPSSTPDKNSNKSK